MAVLLNHDLGARPAARLPVGTGCQARGNVIAAFPFLFLFVFRFSSDLAGREGAGGRGSSPFRDPRSRFAVHGSRFVVVLLRDEREGEQEPEFGARNYVDPGMPASSDRVPQRRI